MADQSNNSTATIKGIIYQFLVALEKCFELRDGEAVYIETYGDISVLGNNSKQIESKFYKGYLNDLDHNVWNTLNNWMKDEFPIEQFKSLVLLTTQGIKTDSPWYGWNDKNLTQKKLSLTNIQKKFLRQKKQSEETAKFLNSVLDSSKNDKLEKILEKFVIDHNSKGDLELYHFLRDTRTQYIPETRKDEFIKYLFGFITNPKAIENDHWSISYTEFSRVVENMTSRLVETTTAFPARIEIDKIKEEDYLNNIFIDKIKEIEYDEIIPEAINDYVLSKELIIKEFRGFPVVLEALKDYEKTVLRNFRTNHRLASRASSDIVNDSKSFFDKMTMYDHGTFYIYNSVPSYFGGGLLHILADEDIHNIKWILTPNINSNE